MVTGPPAAADRTRSRKRRLAQQLAAPLRSFIATEAEVRRELAMGELTDRRRLRIPVLAALTGIVVPAALYLALNPSGEAAQGWGVAISTDTAFALGVLALIGPACPTPRTCGRASTRPACARTSPSAEASGAGGTPTFFVCGRQLTGAYDEETLAGRLREAAAEERPSG